MEILLTSLHPPKTYLGFLSYKNVCYDPFQTNYDQTNF